ncbi:MAG: Mannitol operon repressor [Candidatus Celerinatantimonas neptuna]|nr:MAG: Mannitol operon repressor [Candidatus Celerinatantimonas neptuna]
MDKWDQESEILERLNQSHSIRGFLIQTNELLEESVANLIQRLLRKDDYAIKYAVNPLLSSQGPLGEMDVRLKLIYGLGIISQETYQDIENLMALRDFLNNEAQEYDFTDQKIISEIKSLHILSDISRSQLNFPVYSERDPASQSMQRDRQSKVVRSILTLAITEICKELAKDNALL